jgi:Ser/Thr protein kinase RdoA (MazF antagonist)
VYGLIHQDAHGGNLLVDSDGALTLFDFDDCGYSWFANEIAIVLFYTLTGEPDPLDVLRRFLPPFLDGYRSASPLDDAWLAEIPAFLKLRELELYAVMHRDFDVTAIDDPWCADFMRGRKARIENDTPFLDFDFSRR